MTRSTSYLVAAAIVTHTIAAVAGYRRGVRDTHTAHDHQTQRSDRCDEPAARRQSNIRRHHPTARKQT